MRESRLNDNGITEEEMMRKDKQIRNLVDELKIYKN